MRDESMVRERLAFALTDLDGIKRHIRESDYLSYAELEDMFNTRRDLEVKIAVLRWVLCAEEKI